MRKYFAIVLAAGVFAYLLGLASCGDFDPSKAHLSVDINFANSDETNSYGCDPVTTICAAHQVDWRWVEVTVTELNERTGATAPETGAPVNDVEIAFMTWPIKGDKLYLVTDNRSKVPPLVQPYTMRTDERGHAQIVWVFQGTAACTGDLDSHWIEASVGTAKKKYQIDMTCASTSGDDDSGT